MEGDAVLGLYEGKASKPVGFMDCLDEGALDHLDNLAPPQQHKEQRKGSHLPSPRQRKGGHLTLSSPQKLTHVVSPPQRARFEGDLDNLPPPQQHKVQRKGSHLTLSSPQKFLGLYEGKASKPVGFMDCLDEGALDHLPPPRQRKSGHAVSPSQRARFEGDSFQHRGSLENLSPPQRRSFLSPKQQKNRDVSPIPSCSSRTSPLPQTTKSPTIITNTQSSPALPRTPDRRRRSTSTVVSPELKLSTGGFSPPTNFSPPPSLRISGMYSPPLPSVSIEIKKRTKTVLDMPTLGDAQSSKRKGQENLTLKLSSSSEYWSGSDGEGMKKNYSRRGGSSKRSLTDRTFFQKKKKDKGLSLCGEERETENSWERMEDLKPLRKVAEEFKQEVDAHFGWFLPGFSDHTKDYHSAFNAYILPNITGASPHAKKKNQYVTRFILTITELLYLEIGDGGGGPPPSLRQTVQGAIERIEKVEDIEYKWVAKAEVVWKSSQWLKVLFKMGQDSKETLIGNEIDGLRELINEYLQYLKGTKEPLRQQILEKICYFLLEHLSTHSLDPCNLFVGSTPSEMALEKLFLPFNKSERRSKRAETLEVLLERGWQRSRKRLREERGYDGDGGESEDIETSKEVEDQGEEEQDPEPEEEQGLEEQEQGPPLDSPLDYRDFLRALTRWSSLKQSPNQVTQEVDSLLSLLSTSVTCPAGWYVAVNVSAFQQNRNWFWNRDIDPCGSFKFVLFRLSEALLPSDTVAKIYLDNFETKQMEVPVEDLLYYHKNDSATSLEDERNCKSSFFGTPLSMYTNKICDLIKEKVANFIKENGAKHDPMRLTKLNYDGLEELCRDRMILENIVGSPDLIKDSLVPSLVKPITVRSEFWASQVPPMLFPPPRLEDAVEETTKFMNTLPSLIENEINSHLSLIYTRISAFKKRGADLISGELKNEMCWWWLDHIGTRVDRFLSDHGYQHDTLPDDYLNTPPSDMASVHANQALLGDIIGEEGEKEGKYGVEKLVEEVVGEVYEKVDTLKEEMEFMLEKKWVGLPLEIGWEEGGGEGDVELEEGGEIMKRDHEYLVKMKEMDEKISKAKREGKMEKKELELSDVVPVAGLVMARFHVKNCELNTAIGHWQKMEEMAEKKLRKMKKEREKEKKTGSTTLDLQSIGENRERRKESERWAEVWDGATPRGEIREKRVGPVGVNVPKTP